MKTPTINSRILKLEVLKDTATRTSVNAVESRTTSLESDVATAQGDISTLQGDVATLTQGIQDAVSTHNTSPDSHADLRTLIADRALIEHQHARTDLPWVTDPGAALLTAETVDAQRTALGLTAWAVAPWTDGTTSDVPEGAQLYFTVDRANTCADARIAAQKGQADGLAPLDAGGKVPSTYLPDSVTSFNGRNGAILTIASDYSAFYLGLGAQAADSAMLGGQLPSYYEAAIGNPSVDGYLLSSTTAGVRSWVAPYSHPATHAQSVIDSSTGWITDALANKQPTIAAGTTSQYYRGDKTFQDFATSVRAAILTGLNTSKLSSREVLSTDSLLSAIGLLQGQLTTIVEQSYYAQAGDTKLEIPLSYTGTGTGVLTLRLLSDIAQTSTIDGAGKFYTDSAGTLNESTSFAMAANSWTTFYIKVPSGTCNVTIPNGYAIRAFGNSANNLVTETNNGPKINGLSTSKIRSGVLVVYLYTQLNLGILSGQTYPWLNATLLYFNGNALTISGVAYPWVNATQVIFSGSAMTISGVTYPWVNAAQVHFNGRAMTISGVTYPWVNATQVYFNGGALAISGVTYPWVNAAQVLFYGNTMTIAANISTSALYSGTGNFDLYIDGTGMQVTYPTSRAWPANISRIYLRPSVGSMPSADVDRLFNDLDATAGLTAVGSKVLDLRGNCGAVTAASATARANLAAKGFTVSFNV